MRLLLDAHLSGKRLGRPLRAIGHDVEVLAEFPDLEGLADEQVLELATERKRVLVTRNAKDFAPLLRTWAETGRHHAGAILIWSVPHDRYGALARGLASLLETHPNPADWRDMTRVL